RAGREAAALAGPSRWPQVAALSPDGRTLAVSFARKGSGDQPGPGRELVVWDWATGREVCRTVDWKDGPVRFTPDGRPLVSLSADGVLLADAATAKPIRRLGGHAAAYWGGSVAVSPDGKTLAAACGHAVRLWDLTTGKPLHDEPGHAGIPRAAALSPDGRLAATACSEDGGAWVWDAATGKPLHRLNTAPEWVGCLAFTPHGKGLLVAQAAVVTPGASEDASVCLWDVASGRKLRTFPGHGGAVVELVVAPDGRRFAARDRKNRVRVWDVAGPLLADRESSAKPFPAEA